MCRCGRRNDNHQSRLASSQNKQSSSTFSYWWSWATIKIGWIEKDGSWHCTWHHRFNIIPNESFTRLATVIRMLVWFLFCSSCKDIFIYYSVTCVTRCCFFLSSNIYYNLLYISSRVSISLNNSTQSYYACIRNHRERTHLFEKIHVHSLHAPSLSLFHSRFMPVSLSG